MVILLLGTSQVAISGETYSPLMEITGVPLINFPIPTCWSHWIKFIFDSFPRVGDLRRRTIEYEHDSQQYYSGTRWASWRFKSTTILLFVLQLIWVIDKELLKVCITGCVHGTQHHSIMYGSCFWPYPMWCQYIHYYQVANWYPFCWAHSNSVPMEMIDTECWISPLIWFQCIILSLSFNLDILPSIEFFCVFLKTNTVARC